MDATLSVRRLARGGFLAIALVLFTTLGAALAAEIPPRVEFDTPSLVAVDEIDRPGFAAAHPGEKLVEARLNVSSLVRQGSDQQLTHILYKLETEGGLVVFDYLPKTELAPATVGGVAVEHKSDKSLSIGGTLGGKVEAASGSVSINKSQGEHGQVKYELLPPKELVAAAGTLGRQTGVYFKLKPSAQTSLEGAKQFVIVFRAPQAWRGDRIRLTADATTLSAAMLGSSAQETSCGRASYLIGLHKASDTQARNAVRAFVDAEETWLRKRYEYDRAVEKDVLAGVKKTMRQTTMTFSRDTKESSEPSIPQKLVPAHSTFSKAKADLARVNGVK